MNYREQRALRERALAAGRDDLVQELDETAAELDDLADKTREAHRLWRTASDEQDAMAATLKEVQRQIRELTQEA